MLKTKISSKFRKKGSIIGVFLLAFLFIVIGFLFLVKIYGPFDLNKLSIKNNDAAMDYTIPNVPYYGLHKHFEKRLGDNTNSLFSVVEYWRPGLLESLESENKLMRINDEGDVFTFLSKNNFSFETHRLALPDLKKYVNPEAKTPLLLYLPVAADQPDALAGYPAMAVLIGINDKAQKLTFHNYWMGHNYEISFDEFGQLENKLPLNQRNLFIVARPKDFGEKLKGMAQGKSSDYPARTSVMQKGELMFKNYAAGSMAYNLKMHKVARGYFSKVEQDPQFSEYLPPFFKADLAYMMGRIYYAENDLDNALVYAQRAEAENHDLDKPFKDWPGIEIDWRSGDHSQLSNPYNLLGDVYRQKNDLQKAKDNYLKALVISPNDGIAKSGADIIAALEE